MSRTRVLEAVYPQSRIGKCFEVPFKMATAAGIAWAYRRVTEYPWSSVGFRAALTGLAVDRLGYYVLKLQHHQLAKDELEKQIRRSQQFATRTFQQIDESNEALDEAGLSKIKKQQEKILRKLKEAQERLEDSTDDARKASNNLGNIVQAAAFSTDVGVVYAIGTLLTAARQEKRQPESERKKGDDPADQFVNALQKLTELGKRLQENAGLGAEGESGDPTGRLGEAADKLAEVGELLKKTAQPAVPGEEGEPAGNLAKGENGKGGEQLPQSSTSSSS